jgi:hypothetical protein
MLLAEKSLIQKINLRLRIQGQKLLTSREGTRRHVELGRHYIIDTDHNVLVWKHVELEAKLAELEAGV